MDMSQYLEIFIEESNEHLQHMNEVLLELENNTDDLNLLNEIFRIAHTIKGMSGTMGYTRTANLTHEMENVLQLVRNREIPVTETIINILFECFDALEEYINTLTASGQEGDLDSSELILKLKELAKSKDSSKLQSSRKGLLSKGEAAPAAPAPVKGEEQGAAFNLTIEDIPESVIAEARENGFFAYKVKIILQEGCMLKAARSFIVFNTLEQNGEIIKSWPIAEDIEDERFDNEFEVLYISKLTKEETREEILHISEIKEVIVAETDFSGSSSGTPVSSMTQAMDEAGMIEAEPHKTADSVQPEKLNLKSVKEADSEKAASAKGKTSKTVRVDIDRLDNLMNLVSELIIIKTRLEDYESADNHQNNLEAVEYLERITTSLHDAVMKVRMVPVERVFNRFPRMVRDLAKDLGKSIKLNMSGEETEVDRTVIDEIGDPLIHLIRNSIDHGIESPAERSAKGKLEHGTVDLRAYPDGNTVVIEVEDDGNGINVEHVAQKALEKGIVTREEVESMSQQELIMLLFKPGFSTAAVVTDLSGRGVGLDVVKTKIESLGGNVEVINNPSKGSKFLIRLPLTLAIIQALMVIMGSEKYALPLNNIKEITTIKTAAISNIQEQEVVLYRNATLPILRLGEILNVSGTNRDKDELTVVIVKKGTQEVGLVVDSLIGQQEIVIKSLGKYLTGIKTIAGATILGNGSVALIVDPNQLF